MSEKTYIFEGKTTNEAIEKGLKELKVSKNKVEIKVLENEEKKTFFSILSPKIVKVEMKLIEETNKKENKEAMNIEEIVKELEKFMNDFISKLPTKNIEYEVKKDGNIIKVNIKGDEASYLIGYRGETLNCLQNILTNIASNGKQDKLRVLLDISEYREKREQDLKKLAEKIAESVIKTKKSITLEPMVAYDRKIIHSYLQRNEKVKTHSIGKEPYRKVVISLKEL